MLLLALLGLQRRGELLGAHAQLLKLLLLGHALGAQPLHALLLLLQLPLAALQTPRGLGVLRLAVVQSLPRRSPGPARV